MYKNSFAELKKAIHQKITYILKTDHFHTIEKLSKNNKTLILIKVKQLEKDKFIKHELLPFKDNQCYYRSNDSTVPIPFASIGDHCNKILKEWNDQDEE